MEATVPGRWSVSDQDEIWARWRKGESLRSIGRWFGTHLHAIRRFLARTGGCRGTGRVTSCSAAGRVRWARVVRPVERSTRYGALFPVPGGDKAPTMRDALAAAVARVPAQLRRSLTCDQVKAMAEHVRFTVDTGLQVSCCDPRSPWQRRTNENTNGLLRQYLPRSADVKALTQADLDAIAAERNGRPRQTLGWRTPAERFLELAEAG